MTVVLINSGQYFNLGRIRGIERKAGTKQFLCLASVQQSDITFKTLNTKQADWLSII